MEEFHKTIFSLVIYLLITGVITSFLPSGENVTAVTQLQNTVYLRSIK